MGAFMRYLLCLYLVTSLLAWFPKGPRGAVLCFETTGRVVVEEATACCWDRAASEKDQDSSASLNAIPDACGPCVDVQLGSCESGLVRGSTPVMRPLSADAAIVHPGELTAALLAPRAFEAQPSHGRAGSGSQLRYNILRN